MSTPTDDDDALQAELMQLRQRVADLESTITHLTSKQEAAPPLPSPDEHDSLLTHAAYEHLPLPLAVLRSDGQTIALNQRARALFAAHPATAHPPDEEAIQRVLAGETVRLPPVARTLTSAEDDEDEAEDETRLQWLERLYYPIPDAAGTVRHIGITELDVTPSIQVETALHISQQYEQRQSETRLRRQQLLLQALLDYMPASVFIKDLDGRFLLVNRFMSAYLWMQPEEMIGLLERDVYAASFVEVWREQDRRIRETGVPYHAEEPMPLPREGKPRTQYIIKFPIYDDQGMLYAIGGIATDITERKQAEEQVRQHAARAEALQQMASRLNAQLDLNTVLHRICEAVIEALAVSGASVGLYDGEQDSFSYPVVLGIPADLAAAVQPHSRELIDAHTNEMGAIRVLPDLQVLPDLPNRAVHQATNMRTVAAINILRDGELVGLLVAFTVGETRAFSDDELNLLASIAHQAAQAISNARLFAAVQDERASLTRRIAERTADLSSANAELARAVRAKDEFLANMSHELRTPLNAILGLSEAVQEGIYGPLTDKQSSSLQTIEESGQHLLALINDILDLAKIEADKTTLDIDTMLIAEVCEASVRFIRQSAQKKRLTIATTLPDAGTTMRADERRLKQILVNLLSNAVKFTPDDGQLGLDVVMDAEQDCVCFTVWDTGIGIAAEHMNRLFKPFVQLDAGLNRQHEGSGLGLALVARLTDLHGGSVAVASEPGQGSRFTVTLPWQGIDKPTDEGVQPDGARSIALPGLTKALIIEDSPTAADQLARYLDELHIQTSITAQGAEAVTRAVEFAPDVILLDVLLPDISGWDVLTSLKADPRVQSIPVLIVSVVDDQPHGMARGASGYLIKPITRQRLWGKLERTVLPTAPDTAAADEATPATAANAPLVLLAEDNETILAMLSEYLVARGFQVITARNGAEALMHARETRPALALMDIQMPNMDGLEAIRRIRADTARADIPIIAMTALTMPGDRERCLEAGATAYMSKPVSLKQLVQMMSSYLT
jgi:PAS domain S-box-containing protein